LIGSAYGLQLAILPLGDIQELASVKYANSVIDLVGNTPLVKLNHVTEGISATILVKLEYVNPGGSSKDRIATRIIDAAERDGLLKPGGTIVEPTSGNTGVGLALVAQQRGYRCVFVVPDKVGIDKRNVLTAYGAEVVVTPTSVAPDSPESYYGVSDRLAREIPGAFKPNQYANPNGPLSHYETTGPEIWRDTEGKVTHFVAGVGTGGTISGVGKYLKEVSGGAVQVIGADPEGSVYSGGTGRPYLVEGVGEDFWPEAYDPSVVDRVIAASDAVSFALTRRLAREEGLLVGGSSGLAIAAALEAARDLGPDDVVVVLLPDGGRGYLGKIFNDQWMRSHGFAAADEGPTVADVVAGRELAHLRPEQTVREAIRLLRETGASELPVLAADLPVVLGEVLGAVHVDRLLELVLSGEAEMADAIGGLVGAPLGLVGSGQSIHSALESFGQADTLLVTDGGKPLALLTRTDLLGYLSN
jgi:cystathionine beta-synthase